MSDVRIDPILLKRALDKWGAEAQIIMTIEECSELITELTHLLRGREETAAQEVADVLIVAEQMRLLFGPGLVDGFVTEKMARLEQRLNEYQPSEPSDLTAEEERDTLRHQVVIATCAGCGKALVSGERGGQRDGKDYCWECWNSREPDL